MKYFVLFGLIFSTIAQADFVYMKEDANGKAVVLQSSNSRARTLNDVNSKLWALYPDITPDAEEIVYAEGTNQTDLHLTYQNLTKNSLQRFHHTKKGMVLHPKFTKNGKWIYYSGPGTDSKNTIYFFDREAEVNRQGQGLADYNLENAKALDASEESYFPRPSSDGNFIVYQRNVPGKKEIVLFDKLENKKTILADGMSPSLSFDERLVAYTSKVSGNWNVYIIDRTTKVVTQITSDSADEMAPTFMPDNSVIFASNKSGNYRLYKLLADGQWGKLELNAEAAGVDFYSPQFTGDTSIKQGLKANFIGNPRSSFGTITHDGKLYMAGGHQGAEHTYPPESFTNTFVVYDNATNIWTELAPRPAFAHGYQLAAHGNYIYAFGGFAYSAVHKPKWKSLSQIDRYDIKNNKWETIGQLNAPRSSNVAVTIEGKVYLAGGWDATPQYENDANGRFHSAIEIFDFVTEKSTIASFSIPLPLRRALTGIELNGKIVLVGGLGVGASHFELLNKVTAIDPKDGSSSEMTPLPFSTFAPAAEFLNNTLYVFGGMFQTGPMAYEYVSHIYGLNLETKKWLHTGRTLKETKGFSQVFKLDEETLGVLGGHRYFEGQDSPVSTFETFKVKP